MIATASSSFIEIADYSSKRSSSFFWTLLTLAALDIVLLVWLMNPLSKPSDDLHSARLSSAQVRVTRGDVTAKRSPLGTVAPPVASKVIRRRSSFATLASNPIASNQN